MKTEKSDFRADTQTKNWLVHRISENKNSSNQLIMLAQKTAEKRLSVSKTKNDTSEISPKVDAKYSA